MSDCPRLTQYDSYPPLITYLNQRVLRLSNYSLTSGTTVELSCVNGFHLIGQDVVTCHNGKWDFNTKPYCGDTSSTTSTNTGLSEETKILIGVLVGVLAVVLLIILIIICVVESKIRRSREEKQLTKSRDYDDVALGKDNPGYWSEEVTYKPPSYSRAHAPGIFAIPLQKREFPFRRPLSEPGYSNDYKRNRTQSLHSEEADISSYSFYRPSSERLRRSSIETDYNVPNEHSNNRRKYQSRALPPAPSSHNQRKRKQRNKRSVSSEPATRSNKYIGHWHPRDSIKACSGFNERALLHGRDPFLWKKVDNNWGLHLAKPDVKTQEYFD